MSKRRRCAPLPVVLALLGRAWLSLEGGGGRPATSRTYRTSRVLGTSRRAETVSIPRSEKFRALQALGLDPNGAPKAAEVKKAFRQKVARLHPDLKGGSDTPEFREVLDAYALLTGRRAGGSSPSSDPFSQGFDLRRSTGGKTEEEKEAEFQQPGNWRWDQNAGYNPGDLEEVWSEIGYNPYTGEYREVAGRPEAEEPDWVPEPEPLRPRARPSPASQRRRSRFGIARASDIPEPLPLGQILTYVLLAAVSLFFVFAPEQLMSEEERAKYLEDLERREQLKAEQFEERAALEILWRERVQRLQREEDFSQLGPIDELAMLESATDETRSLFAADEKQKS